MSDKTSYAALAAALSGLMGIVTTTLAQAADDDREQCAGIVRAGQNDCATSQNACHGHVTSDADPEAWIYVPKGTCAKLIGARVVQVVDPTPKNKR